MIDKLDLPYRRDQQLMTAIIMQAIRDHQAILTGSITDMFEIAEAATATEWLRDPAISWMFKVVGLDQRTIWRVMDTPGLVDKAQAQVRSRKRRIVVEV